MGVRPWVGGKFPIFVPKTKGRSGLLRKKKLSKVLMNETNHAGRTAWRGEERRAEALGESSSTRKNLSRTLDELLHTRLKQHHDPFLTIGKEFVSRENTLDMSLRRLLDGRGGEERGESSSSFTSSRYVHIYL
ncbi:hypothetical protein R1flu_006741 [Riccia fluitans]|uniref:Uncharacterized protein n=1 Tax=Riccia fluitans TaxID=41844 RepID=A0ABD1YZW9_9MARC